MLLPGLPLAIAMAMLSLLLAGTLRCLLHTFCQTLPQCIDSEQVPALGVREAAASLASQPWSATVGTQHCWPAGRADAGMPV